MKLVDSNCLAKVCCLLFAVLLPVQALLDLDGNGVSDIWEQANLDISVDADGDGVSNFNEAIAGTDPNDPGSFLALNEPVVSDNEISFQWQGLAGKQYHIEKWDSQSEKWETVSSVGALGLDGPQMVGISRGDGGFFRLVAGDVGILVDGDGDGLSAWEENQLGWSDSSGESSGDPVKGDFAVALRALESPEGLSLASGEVLSQRMPSREEASRFLIKASFGPTEESITQVCQKGLTGWLDEQMALPETKTMQQMYRNFASLDSSLHKKGLWRCFNVSKDQLRHRMAYALSQIFVVNMDGGNVIGDNPHTQATYYDFFVTGAFGSYRDILEQVTYSPVMGFYLSHLKNRKSDPAINRFPDENFAREIMQLFTIGLWELNPDGSPKLDLEGALIPSYNNETITEMAKVFTGMSHTRVSGGLLAGSFFDIPRGEDYRYPMKVWDEEHESGPKNIINDVVLGGTQTGEEEVQAALDALVSHDNIAPFVSRLLIQRFTSSSPSPKYIGRVSRAWEGNSLDDPDEDQLARVIEAILLDPETLSLDPEENTRGKVREPIIRLAALYRAFHIAPPTNIGYSVDINGWRNELAQYPTLAPTVFNFYLPDYSPSGEMAARNIFSPELQIATLSQLILSDNRFRSVINLGHRRSVPDYTLELSMAKEAELLVSHLSELLTGGRLGELAKSAIVSAVEAQGSDLEKVQTAVHLVSQSMECLTIE